MSTPLEYTMTTTAVAKRLGVAISTVGRWADEGRIPSITTPGGWRKFRPSDIDAVIDTMFEPKGVA